MLLVQAFKECSNSRPANCTRLDRSHPEVFVLVLDPAPSMHHALVYVHRKNTKAQQVQYFTLVYDFLQWQASIGGPFSGALFWNAAIGKSKGC